MMLPTDTMLYCDDRAQCCGILGPLGMHALPDGSVEAMLAIVYADGTRGAIPASKLMRRPQKAEDQ